MQYPEANINHLKIYYIIMKCIMESHDLTFTTSRRLDTFGTCTDIVNYWILEPWYSEMQAFTKYSLLYSANSTKYYSTMSTLYCNNTILSYSSERPRHSLVYMDWLIPTPNRAAPPISFIAPLTPDPPDPLMNRSTTCLAITRVRVRPRASLSNITWRWNGGFAARWSEGSFRRR